MLKDVLVELSHRLKWSPHIAPLLKQEQFSIAFFSTEEQIVVRLYNNELSFEEGDTKPAVVIRGEDTALIGLIEGSTRLQQLHKRGEVHITGKYKNILRLESLLYCCSKSA